MTDERTTLKVSERALTYARVLAAKTGRKQYDIVEEALKDKLDSLALEKLLREQIKKQILKKYHLTVRHEDGATQVHVLKQTTLEQAREFAKIVRSVAPTAKLRLTLAIPAMSWTPGEDEDVEGV